MPETIWVTSWRTGTIPSPRSGAAVWPGRSADSRLVRSMPLRRICTGYSERVSRSISAIYWLTPVDREMIRAMPMMPIEPAKAVSRVRVFLVQRLLKLRVSEVHHDMEEWPMFL